MDSGLLAALSMGILLMEESVARLRLFPGCGRVTSRLPRSGQNPSGSTSLGSVYSTCLLVTEPHLLCSGSDIPSVSNVFFNNSE